MAKERKDRETQRLRLEAKAERDYKRNTKKVKVSREGSSQESQKGIL